MKLITLHRILISTMIAFCAFFVWQQIDTWKARGDRTALYVAIASAVAAVGLTWYLTNLRRFVRLEPPADRKES